MPLCIKAALVARGKPSFWKSIFHLTGFFFLTVPELQRPHSSFELFSTRGVCMFIPTFLIFNLTHTFNICSYLPVVFSIRFQFSGF